jgi:hypothetical protein
VWSPQGDIIDGSVAHMLHKDSIVQLTHDFSAGRDVLVRKGTAGRVLSATVLRRACVVEFAVSPEQTIVAKVGGQDVVEVRPNARA